MPSPAATAFQEILDHRGIVFADPIGALARLQLARAYTLEAGIDVGPGFSPAHAVLKDGATSDALAKARTAYHDFLTLWKNADPDIPILKQAKAESARLQ